MKATDAWISRADNPSALEYILCVDEGTTYVQAHPGAFPVSRFEYVVNRKRHCAVDGWNTAAEHSTGKLLITIADDWMPPEHWDTLLLVQLNLDKPAVVWVNSRTDGRIDPIMMFSILTRPYYEKYGYIFYPEYIGMFGDNDFTDVALRDSTNGECDLIDCRKSLPVFEHRHPEYKTAPDDEIYQRQHRSEAYRVGAAVYNRRKLSGFKDLRYADVEKALSEPKLHRRVGIALPFRQNEWLNGFLAMRNVLAYLGFDIADHVGYASDGPDVTRMEITGSVLQFHEHDNACPYVLWLDDDNVIEPETLVRWFEFMDEHPDADILSGWCWMPVEGGWATTAGVFSEDKQWTPFDLKAVFSQGQDIRQVLNFVNGFAAVLMRRDVLEKLGKRSFERLPLEKGMWGFLNEDQAWWWRANQAGFKCYFDPLGKIRHLKLQAEEPSMFIPSDAPEELKRKAAHPRTMEVPV